MHDIPLAVAVLCWTPGVDPFGAGVEPTFQVRVLGDPFNDHGPHEMTAGAVYSDWQKAAPKTRLRMLFGEVMSLMARDAIPFELVHRELLRIPEYRGDVLADDVEGADRK